MPKSTTTIPGTRKVVRAKRKFAIGGRKSSNGAHMMSTADLIKLLVSPNRKRDRNRILAVLKARGKSRFTVNVEDGPDLEFAV